MRIKKDDMVMVIAGKDKGKTGKVLKAMPKENRVIVEGVNIQTKHAKQTRTSAAEIKHHGRSYRCFKRNVLRQQGKGSVQKSDTRWLEIKKFVFQEKQDRKLIKKGGDDFGS